MNAALAGQPGGGRIVTLAVRDGFFKWVCPDCGFRRYYATRAGAIQKITEHALQTHGVQLTFHGEVR